MKIPAYEELKLLQKIKNQLMLEAPFLRSYFSWLIKELHYITGCRYISISLVIENFITCLMFNNYKESYGNLVYKKHDGNVIGKTGIIGFLKVGMLATESYDETGKKCSYLINKEGFWEEVDEYKVLQMCSAIGLCKNHFRDGDVPKQFFGLPFQYSKKHFVLKMNSCEGEDDITPEMISVVENLFGFKKSKAQLVTV